MDVLLAPGMLRTEELWPGVSMCLTHSMSEQLDPETRLEPSPTGLTRSKEGYQSALPRLLATPSLACVSTPAVQVEILGGITGRAWLHHSFPRRSHLQKGTRSESPALPSVFQSHEEQVNCISHLSQSLLPAWWNFAAKATVQRAHPPNPGSH